MRTDRRALARALVADWDAGAERIWYGQLPDDVVATAEVASALDELDRSPWDRHGRLLRASLLLDPAMPPVFRGTLVAPEHLAELAAAAARGGPGSSAFEVLCSLRDQEVLTAVGELTGAAWAHRLARDWAGARREAAALVAAHADGSTPVAGELRTVGDAWLLELLVDRAARTRILAQVAAVEGGERLPAWFRAARSPDASASALLTASLLIGQVRREVLADEGHGAEPSSDASSDASTSAADERSGARRRAAPAGGADVADDRDRQDADRLLERSVAVGLASVVAAAALWWPIVTSIAVLVWLVVDRTVSWVADPFLRLVGGWPLRIRGWALAWLPLRVVGLVLRAPWRLLGDVLLLVLGVVLVDRLLAAGHLAAGWLVEGGIDTPRGGFVARWFAPVWSGSAAWLATRRWSGGPPLRGAALVAGSLRRTSMAVRASFLAVSVLLLITAARTPSPDPWAPYDDHRAAILAVLPFGDAIERFTDGRDRLLPDPELPSLFDDEPGTADDADRGEEDDPAAPGAARWQVVGVAGLNVRAGPGTGFEVVGSLTEGMTATGLGPIQDVDGTPWVQVRLDDGTQGWASGRYLEQVAP